MKFYQRTWTHSCKFAFRIYDPDEVAWRTTTDSSLRGRLTGIEPDVEVMGFYFGDDDEETLASYGSRMRHSSYSEEP